MKYLGLPLALQTAILAVAFSTAAAQADGMGGSAFSGHAVRAKIQYCLDCHGISGRGYRGYYPIPRLAGQTSEYFKNQLRAFIERSREKNIDIVMSKVHGLNPELGPILAAHFTRLDPNPIGGGPKRLVDIGRKIYEEGIPDANVPACSACHGPGATGEGANPRLAGQLYPYTVKELVNWSKERGQVPGAEDTSAVMAPIAQSLSRSQIDAVAAYLSYLK
ncbi:MAG: c-type cytochrome [Rhodomicrobium sp.]